jgi:Ribulose-5-phosphate 4-epimerase and related epimerases and aldolases
MGYENALKNDIAEYMRRLCERGLTTVLGGNISCRTDNGMLITPSSVEKFRLNGLDVVEMDLNGKVIAGLHKPSIEHWIHACVYKLRPDVNAVIHSHSFYSTLFSIIDKEINVEITAESAKNIGIVGVADYAIMGTKELADSVGEKVKEHDIVLMKNHGVISVGSDLLEAFYRLEIAEQTARLTYHSFGVPFSTIAKDDLEKYLKKSKKNN